MMFPPFDEEEFQRRVDARTREIKAEIEARRGDAHRRAVAQLHHDLMALDWRALAFPMRHVVECCGPEFHLDDDLEWCRYRRAVMKYRLAMSAIIEKEKCTLNS